MTLNNTEKKLIAEHIDMLERIRKDIERGLLEDPQSQVDLYTLREHIETMYEYWVNIQ